jgi:hypothetical protein
MQRLSMAPVSLFIISSGYSAVQPQASAVAAGVDISAPHYPVADTGLGETPYPDEEVLAGQIASAIEKSIRKQYQSGDARRDAHPKAHGCVKATLHVDETLPDNFAQGIFVPGKTYQAWIRFSNGSQDPTRADIKGDARGMAIKVMGVAGDKLLESGRSATTQDFIMINHPVFFADDPKRYLSFIEKSTDGGFFGKLTIPFSLGIKGTLIAFETTRSKIANPLYARYWSMVPYQLGVGPDRKVIKLSAKPCSAETQAIPKSPAHDYLRDALRSTLQSRDACMELLLQPRTSDSLSVEDPRIEWKESQAPFHKAATLLIPRQVFDTDEQNRFCENLSFTPWHALPEHRPLGVTNRLRKIIYERISQVRHEMNSSERQEP